MAEHLHTIGPPLHLIGNQRSTMKCATGPRDPLLTKEAYYPVNLKEENGYKSTVTAMTV